MARVAFDAFDRHFEPGDAFPYAELGVTEDFALGWWRAAMLEVAQPFVQGGRFAVPVKATEPVRFMATRGERVVVDQPSKKGKHKETP